MWVALLSRYCPPSSVMPTRVQSSQTEYDGLFPTLQWFHLLVTTFTKRSWSICANGTNIQITEIQTCLMYHINFYIRSIFLWFCSGLFSWCAPRLILTWLHFCLILSLFYPIGNGLTWPHDALFWPQRLNCKVYSIHEWSVMRCDRYLACERLISGSECNDNVFVVFSSLIYSEIVLWGALRSVGWICIDSGISATTIWAT